MRGASLRFSVGRLMICVAAAALVLASTCRAGFEPTALVPIAVIGLAVMIPSRAKFLGLVAAAVILAGFLSPSRRHYQGLARRTLNLRVVEAGSGIPIAGAAVSVEPIEPQSGYGSFATVRGTTDADGQADLNCIFKNAGSIRGRRKSEYVYFSYWAITVEAPGYRPLRAGLSGDGFPGLLDGATAPPLNLSDPLPSLILIRLEPSQATDPSRADAPTPDAAGAARL